MASSITRKIATLGAAVAAAFLTGQVAHTLIGGLCDGQVHDLGYLFCLAAGLVGGMTGGFVVDCLTDND